MKLNQTEIITYINELENYQGFVQFSHRPIDKEKDIFYGEKSVKVENEKGFIYEAYFYNEEKKKSIAIKQINSSWLVSETDILNIDDTDTEKYTSDIKDFKYKIKMAQIWEEQEDKLCENMKVTKLKKIEFVGFENV
ncbi:MAG: TIGR04423 family type III CRISPR-associated protein [Sulfurovum sp.]|nr:TIGR04423 family type III CRISPR-associated protein [Sulfurovaceae bacterium]